MRKKLNNLVDNFDVFFDKIISNKIERTFYICTGNVLKNSILFEKELKNTSPKILFFYFEKEREICKVIELKDGDVFDTKKSQGEKEHLEKFARVFGANIPFTTQYFICSFNQEDKEAIKIGFKNVFDYKNIMTGRELCELLGLDYDKIIESRKQDAKENLDYFIDQILLIPEIKEIIKTKI